MKVAFAMPFKNEINALTHTLPKIPFRTSDFRGFDGFIFLDTGSTDGSNQLVKKYFPEVNILTDHIDHLDFGRWRNMMMDEARRLGMDWIFMIDSDEVMYYSDYERAFTYMEKGENTLLRLARINMITPERYVQKFYPDWQARLIKLDAGYVYTEKTHAQPILDGKLLTGDFLVNCVIYHLSYLTSDAKLYLKQMNYKLTMEGKPILDKLPEGMKYPLTDWLHNSQLFIGKLP